jgi:uncharacterized protein YPO0396
MTFDIPFLQLLLPAAGAIATLGGAYLTIQNITKNLKEEKEKELGKVLSEAKEDLSILRTEMDNKINETNAKLRNLEINVNKDLDHLKETYNAEIRNLGAKIEELRDELRSQHGSLVTLLTKVIDKT